MQQPTDKGMPVGTPTMATIDSAGGMLSSADGVLDVTIPAGALAMPTVITIQPITNMAPNGVALGYRLSPEGMTFATPATLTFHVDRPDDLFVATQHDDNTWWSPPHQTFATGVITVPAPHFSDWSLSATLYLTPQQKRVRTKASATFTAKVLVKSQVTADGEDLAIPEAIDIDDPDTSLPGMRTWAVNGKSPGDATIGNVVDGVYTAPATPPSPRDVTISVAVEIDRRKVIATAEADIYTTETWTGVSDMVAGDGTIIHASFTFEQDLAASVPGKDRFVVKVGTVSAKPPDPTGCTLTISPSMVQMTPQEGTMIATYDLGTSPESPRIQGQGQTQWLATYTTVCPNGTGTIQTGVFAAWWPLGGNGMPIPLVANNAGIDQDISGASASGHLKLARDP